MQSVHADRKWVTASQLPEDVWGIPHSNGKSIADDTLILISKEQDFSHEQNRSNEQEIVASLQRHDPGQHSARKASDATWGVLDATTNIQLSKRCSAWHMRFGVSCVICKFVMRDTIAMHLEKWKYCKFRSSHWFQQIQKKL